MNKLTIDEKRELITKNLQEILGKQELDNLLLQEEIKIYWGTAPTGRIHIGYFIQFLKIVDYIKAGCKVKILIADLHAVLDNLKTSMELLNARTEYYITMIKEVLLSLNVDLDLIEFVKGSDYQLSQNYTLDVYKLNSKISYQEAKHAGAEVVKQTQNPTMTGLLYPSLQALDEHYLDVHIQSGGIDQRKIFTFARSNLNLLGYKKSIHLMTPMVQGLRFNKKEIKNVITKEEKLKLLNIDFDLPDNYVDTLYKKYINNDTIKDDKMSSSNNDSKIDLLDTKNEIKKKINKSYCLPCDVEDNCLMDLLEKVIFPVLSYKNQQFIINRKEKFGGIIIYDSFDNIKNDFALGKLHPQDFKLGITDSLNYILEPIRNSFETKERKLLLKKAYN
ncbi:tyrosyl-tRNA synthetase [Hokovirus HKV1]|uniref:tyrosine--tRNA ligase n=1 Tax=Hokovirus HKV1 TaxID=1977638 RepID=A0A1V0SGE2_9VIRU|nr:tyrosyl-tRNA synthetase [Hokovirus HKV1]